MKKETVTTMLDTLERQTKKVADEKERKAQLAAIARCRTWLALPWVQMLTPIESARKVLGAKAMPLLEKQRLLSDDECMRLSELVAAGMIYDQFETKIRPTVRRALLNQKERQRDQAARSAANHSTE